MKRKIVGIIVLMLVATAVVSATHIDVKKNIQPTSSSVDVPVWKKGDSWTFNEHNTMHRYLTNGTLWFTWSRNDTLTCTVIDDTGDNYTIKESSTDNGGFAIIGSYRLKFTPLTKFTDEFTIRKTDLAYYYQLFVDKGFVFWLFGKIGFPIPARYYLLSEASYKSPMVDLPFPLIAGTQGNLPGYSYTYQEKITLYWGLITLYDLPKENFTQGPLPYHCEMVNITVLSGNYNAYNVSVDVPNGLHGHYSNWLYYVPEVGHTAKGYTYFTDGAGKLIQTYGYELVDFNYTP